VVGARDYDPYGAILQQQGVIPSPLGFAGEWHDSATGLQYLRARWYQPATGRFTQVDPFPGVLSLPATQHPYQYALNNPLRYTDPSGESVLLSVLMAVGIGAVIGGAVGGIGYALQHPGQSLGEYARNAEFQRAVGVGAASGAVAGLVGWAVPAGFAALGMKAATAGGAAFIGGITGALAAGAGRITANLLTPCMKWYTGVSSAMFWGALGGALLGWAGWHVRQWLWQKSPHIAYRNPGEGQHPNALREGFQARDPTANYSPAYHVSRGSNPNVRTQYLSLTKSLNVALDHQGPNTPIYVIDLRRVSSNIIDLTNEVVRRQLLRFPMTEAFARKSFEVLVESYIPPEAIVGLIFGR